MRKVSPHSSPQLPSSWLTGSLAPWVFGSPASRLSSFLGLGSPAPWLLSSLALQLPDSPASCLFCFYPPQPLGCLAPLLPSSSSSLASLAPWLPDSLAPVTPRLLGSPAPWLPSYLASITELWHAQSRTRSLHLQALTTLSLSLPVSVTPYLGQTFSFSLSLYPCLFFSLSISISIPISLCLSVSLFLCLYISICLSVPPCPFKILNVLVFQPFVKSNKTGIPLMPYYRKQSRKERKKYLKKNIARLQKAALSTSYRLLSCQVVYIKRFFFFFLSFVGN